MIEVTSLTKNVAAFRQLFLRDPRQHLVNDERHILLWRVPEFIRNCMGAQKRGHKFERRLRIQSANHAQNLDFIVDA